MYFVNLILKLCFTFFAAVLIFKFKEFNPDIYLFVSDITRTFKIT